MCLQLMTQTELFMDPHPVDYALVIAHENITVSVLLRVNETKVVSFN